MRIDTELKLDYQDVLIRPKRSRIKSRQQVDLTRSYTFMNSNNSWSGVPIVAANMDGVGTFKMHKALSRQKLFTCIVKHYQRDDWINKFLNKEYIAISVGTNLTEWENAKKIILEFDLKWICIDIANGYSEHFSKFVRMVRSYFPELNIIAGNVVTADMTQELLLAGADIIKVGIGPGSVCTTRIKTGVGYPQLSAVIECADAAHGLGGHIIADGGCTSSGDVAKAFAAGADFVMLGGMLAGHEEGGGTIKEIAHKTNYYSISYDGEILDQIYEKEKFVEFYGMSSKKAMDTHHGGVAYYRAAEGKLVKIPYKGKVINTVNDILGGLRSSCSYVGATRLKDISKCTTFIRCSQQYNAVFGHQN
tara:strand:- start:78 stop:1166 length:1089 start_codon:yes stop_codon:yes gene_type:complete